MPPKVSILLPTYDRPGWLEESMNSILSQDFTDFELLILDHGSRPETASVLDRIVDHRIKRFRVEVNKAPGQKSNYGLLAEHVVGEYCVLFTDDDLMLPGSLWLKVAALDSGFGLCLSPVVEIDGSGRVIGLTRMGMPLDVGMDNCLPFDDLFSGNRVAMPSVMFRSEFLRFWESPFGVLCDWAFWLEIANTGVKAKWIEMPTVKLRYHDKTDSMGSGVRSGGFLRLYPLVWKYWVDRGYRPKADTLEAMARALMSMSVQYVNQLARDIYANCA